MDLWGLAGLWMALGNEWAARLHRFKMGPGNVVSQKKVLAASKGNTAGEADVAPTEPGDRRLVQPSGWLGSEAMD